MIIGISGWKYGMLEETFPKAIALRPFGHGSGCNLKKKQIELLRNIEHWLERQTPMISKEH